MSNSSISPARKAALAVLERVLTRGETLLESLPFLEDQCPDPRDTALAREIAFGTCRWLGRIQSALLQYAPKFHKFPPPVQRILEMAGYQLLFLDRVPAYAVISDAVNLTRWRKFQRLTGAVNAILRAFSKAPKKGIALPDSANKIQQMAATCSHPEWLLQQWMKTWDEDAVTSLCEYNNTRADISLRLRIPYQQAAEKLQALNITFTRDERFPNRITIPAEQAIDQNLFTQTSWVVQDGAAMLVAQAANAQPGQRIWDVCAAPGGKTCFIADQMGNSGEILASDKSAVRLQKLEEQKERLGLSCIKTRVFDAVKDHPLPEMGSFDMIVLDVPCSGWGTFRRHPDLRWRLKPEDPDRLAAMAKQMLENTAANLRPDGVLLYSTCTLSLEENEGVVRSFLQTHSDFCLDPIGPAWPEVFKPAIQSEGWLRLFPPQWNLDGAFAARIRKLC